MIRNWLRRWLGVTDEPAKLKTLDGHLALAWERIVAIEVEHSALSKKQAELNAILQEVRQLREMLADPKRQPIATRTTHQFRALMEQE
jgi:hypothetical protein